MVDFDDTEDASIENFEAQEGELGIEVKFDLECYFKSFANGILINCVFDNSLFKKETISYWINNYVSLVEQVAETPSIKIKEIEIFETPLLNIDYPEPKNTFTYFEAEEINQNVVSRFEKQVENDPNSIALYQSGKQISYEELNSRANGLATRIISTLKNTNQRIALLLGHGESAIVGMLSVLKTGNVYVPLDPNYPFDRLVYMLEDSGCNLILAESSTLSLANNLISSLSNISIIDISEQIDFSATNINVELEPESEAYILYTSGSTGEPKGVRQSHKNILHYIRVYTNNLHIAQEDKLSLLPTYSFDASVMDIFGALLNGASLCVYNIRELGLENLAGWLVSNEVSIFHTVPTIYRYFIDELDDQIFKYVRLVILGGEAVTDLDFVKFKKHFEKGSIFINGYGPTESTITLQNFLNHDTQLASRNVPIGRPVDKTRVYLLDEENQEVGIYQEGEIVHKSDYLSLDI